MVYQALPSTHMASAHTLSHQDNMDTTQDNTNVQLLPSDAFDQQIWATNVALANKIKDLSSSNLLVLQAIHEMEKELPLFNRLKAKDWTFDNGQLYYKTCLYIPKIACHDLVSATHCSFKGSHGGHLWTIVLLSKDYWWLGLSTYVGKYISGCVVYQVHKVLIHPMVPAIIPLTFKESHYFQNLSVYYNWYFSSNGLSTFSSVHPILSCHDM